MISIILSADGHTKQEALKLGFQEQTVLVRHEGGISSDENKRKIEGELFKLQPYQFLVSDFWGAGPE